MAKRKPGTRYEIPPELKVEFVDGMEIRSTDNQVLISWLQSFPPEDQDDVLVLRILARHVMTWARVSRVFGAFGNLLVDHNLDILTQGFREMLKDTDKDERDTILTQLRTALERAGEQNHV